VNLRRLATNDLITSNGLKVKKGDEFVVDTSKMSDPEIYLNLTRFDIYRYYRRRENPDTTAKSQFVSTSTEDLSFGFGNYACPGRFFAANELKLALCHLLLKYEWELSQDASVESVLVGGVSLGLNLMNKLKFRYRKAELDLSSLMCA
jgi:cytochrome P450